MKKALVLSLALVFGLGVASFAQTLSGSWETNIGIIPSPVALTIDSELIVTYAVSGWSFTSITTVNETRLAGPVVRGRRRARRVHHRLDARVRPRDGVV